jgi:rRNA maturation endonuclease Nob1
MEPWGKMCTECFCLFDVNYDYCPFCGNEEGLEEVFDDEQEGN